MLVSVIIINYNTFRLTCGAIRSVRQFTKGVDYEIIVVDNASPADHPDDFLTEFPDIKLVKSPVNGGFAKGNNLGIDAAEGDFILLLNSDAYLTEDAISVAARKLDALPRCGALTVKLVYENGHYQRNARRFRSIRNELLDLFRPVLYLLPYRTRARLMLNQYFHGDFDTDCDWVSGAYMMMRREHIRALPGGKLDERYFMYGEDQLWCYQFAQRGLSCYFAHNAQAVHIANASTQPEKVRALFHTGLRHEFDLIGLRKGGKGVYYQMFRLIFGGKEYARHLLKGWAKKLLGKNIR